MSSDARNLITRLLNREPEGRLGTEGAEEIKKHPFFKTSMSSLESLISSNLSLS